MDNEKLEIDALNLLNGVQDEMHWKLKVKLRDLEKESPQQNEAGRASIGRRNF